MRYPKFKPKPQLKEFLHFHFNGVWNHYFGVQPELSWEENPGLFMAKDPARVTSQNTRNYSDGTEMDIETASYAVAVLTYNHLCWVLAEGGNERLAEALGKQGYAVRDAFLSKKRPQKETSALLNFID